VAWSAAQSGIGAVPARSVGPVTSEGLVLDIPPAEETAARARGAVWDDPNQRWCVPAGSPVEVHRFRRWISLRDTFVDDGPAVAARLVGLQRYCERCGSPVVALAGVLVAPGLSGDDDGFVPFAAVAEALARACPPRVLAGHGVGPLHWRHTGAAPQGQVTNGCCRCDAVVDSDAVAQDLATLRAGGGGFAGLAMDLEVPVPLAVLEWAGRG